MTLKGMFVVALLFGAVLTVNQASAQDARDAVYTNLNWSAADSGFNEGGLCGFEALQGVAGVELPEVPFVEYYALGNVWPRVDMMNAAIFAYRSGFRNAGVTAAICSQIHNPAVSDLLSQHPDMVGDWLGSAE
jgi:hypothetical protein